MVTNFGENRMVNYDLLSFLNDIGCNDMQFKLLCFWGRHPKAKLSLYRFATTLDRSKNNIRDAILALIKKGILIVQNNNNGLVTYELSDKQSRKYIDELASLDYSQKMNLRNQLRGMAISTADKTLLERV